jgi:hypothetical protein
MPFGLTNAPASFQDMMNYILKDLLDKGIVVYIDDILIYAKNTEQHDKLVEEVLERLAKNDFVISPEKFVWAEKKLEFLGYIITPDGMRMAKDKTEAIQAWQTPQSLRDIQSFLGFANFYRRFIFGFSKICRPLTESTKGDKKDWRWTSEIEKAFVNLKECFTTVPILTHFNPKRQCIVETDATDFVLGAVLSQKEDDDMLHPIAYHSRKFSLAEINYKIHDKELLDIVDSFKIWRRYLEGALLTVLVYTDHQNLQYFTTTKVLNRRQARWAQELAGIDFKICYRPGSQNGKPDARSRRSEYRPPKGGSEKQQIQTVLQKKHFEPQTKSPDTKTDYTEEKVLIAATKLPYKRWLNWDKNFLEEIKEEALKDEDYKEAMKSLEKNEENSHDTLRQEERVLYHRTRLWVPCGIRTSVLESEHDSKVAGHRGQDKTKELIRRNFWWPKMNEDIIQYVQSYPEYQMNKAARHKSYGLLQPVEPAYSPWKSIAMDFITDLPLSEGCDQLWVIIDRFTKMAYFIPLKTKNKKAEDLAEGFTRDIWKLYGIPADIISDRASRFTSKF